MREHYTANEKLAYAKLIENMKKVTKISPSTTSLSLIKEHRPLKQELNEEDFNQFKLSSRLNDFLQAKYREESDAAN